MAQQWYKFPNGKVWQVDENGRIEGTVSIPGVFNMTNDDQQMDEVSEGVTGSIVGVTDLLIEHLGDDIISFGGNVGDLVEAEDTDLVELAADSDELREALQAQYSLLPTEAEHALDSLGNEYGEECVLGIVGSGRQLRCPSPPAKCDYVRVVVDGLELAFWSSDEWAEAPAAVMGALLGAARSGR